jgi:hypothetical protein
LFGLWGGAKKINKIECDAVRNQILWNAVILVQGLWFIENGERISPKDDRVTGNGVSGLNHILGFTGFGKGDFQSADNRVTSILKWFEQKRLTDDANIVFLNIEGISWWMNELYNYLKKKLSTALNSKRYGQVLIIKRNKLVYKYIYSVVSLVTRT